VAVTDFGMVTVVDVFFGFAEPFLLDLFDFGMSRDTKGRCIRAFPYPLRHGISRLYRMFSQSRQPSSRASTRKSQQPKRTRKRNALLSLKRFILGAGQVSTRICCHSGMTCLNSLTRSGLRISMSFFPYRIMVRYDEPGVTMSHRRWQKEANRVTAWFLQPSRCRTASALLPCHLRTRWTLQLEQF